ncbi:MAG TPA: tetratricopeptide repeat protein [Cellvibrio sp.]|nr:tetratricopeptide repeat protein [Cellvibrio sp.]
MIFNPLKIQWWFGLMLLVLAGCTTQSPTEKTPDSTSALPTSLTPAEAKNYQNAVARIEEGEAGKAIGGLQKLTQAHPGQPGIWLNLAIAQYQEGELDKAKTTLDQAQRLTDKIPEMYNLAGLIAVDEGDYTTADKHYQKALKLNKHFADAHYNLALLCDIFYQDIERAVEHYQQYLTLIKQEDKATTAWVEELKLTLKRRGEG